MRIAILNVIKKGLALKIMEEFPIFDGEILFAPNVPIFFSLRHSKFWEEGEENLLKTGEIRNRLNKIFSRRKARITDIYPGQGEPETVSLKYLTIKFEAEEEFGIEELVGLESDTMVYFSQKIRASVHLLCD